MARPFCHEEKRDLDHLTEYPEPNTLLYRLTNTESSGRYRIVKEIVVEPHSAVLLIHTRLEINDPTLRDKLRLYVLLAPHLNGSGKNNSASWHDVGGRRLLHAWREDTHLVLGCAPDFARRSVGFVGASDGWQDLMQNFQMDWNFDSALDGNIALLGEVDLSRGLEFTVAVAFGFNARSASTQLLQALASTFASQREKYVAQWQRTRPGPDQIRVKVAACGVCRTDLHVVDGELPDPKVPIIPGHEIVGRIDVIGAKVKGLTIGERVGIPWLGHTCGVCPYCVAQRENLCDQPLFTGYTRDGGFATAVIADARFAFPLGETGLDVALAPLLCAGLIGWRSLAIAGNGKKIGLYGFGAAAHIIAQVARWQGRSVFAFTRPGDTSTQTFARSLGAVWAGDSDEPPPEPLDAAIIFATLGDLVPLALKAVRKGGRVVCAGIHMSDIPSFPYRILWEERQLLSVANLTRQDGLDFLGKVPEMNLVVKTKSYPLPHANEALADLRAGKFEGAAVLVP